ncbi:MAPK-interacting and spindle-stabilizing protein-like [Zea mays]|uniref:MAPK-interacting and spindle-stabilizing protein-like n=1 Tax=Zea mays TaxID=4577 RepID=UPI0004DE85FF|nr:MAPK-interacting and spindle-stabilizing protein-like [Zea mays]
MAVELLSMASSTLLPPWRSLPAGEQSGSSSPPPSSSFAFLLPCFTAARPLAGSLLHAPPSHGVVLPPMAQEMPQRAPFPSPWLELEFPHGAASLSMATQQLPPMAPPALPPWRPEFAAASPSPKLLLPWPILPCALLSHGNPAGAPFPPWSAPRAAPLRDSPSPNSEPASSLLVVVPAGCSAKCAASRTLQQPSSSFSTSPSRVIALVFAAQRTACRDSRRVFAVLRSSVVVVVHPGDNPVFCVEKASRSTLVDVVAMHKSESPSSLQTPIGFVYGEPCRSRLT